MSRDRSRDEPGTSFDTGVVTTSVSVGLDPSLQTDTRAVSASGHGLRDLWVPALTVLWHSDPERIGERAGLPELASGRVVELSRLEPLFRPPGASPGRSLPLADPHLSRTPLRLEPLDERSVSRVTGDLGVRLDATGTSTEVRLQDRVVSGPESPGPVDLGPGDLDRGVVLLLARRVALVLHRLAVSSSTPETPSFSMVGESDALHTLRRELHRVAPLAVPVLLRGETGTGKELAAKAIHQASPRRERPFVVVNAAAIQPNLAAAELFGARRGAYTGADQAREGYFRQADGGTLFLDEIGELPAEVQPLLLRVLETGEVQTVGGGAPETVDVRLVAATDLDLEKAVEAGDFRAPLYHRLSSTVVQVPSLARRREDFGRLLLYFLGRELAELGAEEVLSRTVADPGAPPWLAADLVARLAEAAWPGNLRELGNLARRLAVTYHDQSRVVLDPEIRTYSREVPIGPAAEELPPTSAPPEKAPKSYRAPADVGEEELLEALADHRYRLKPAAKALGISRPSLYNLIAASPRLRIAAELERDELEAAWERHDGSLEALVDELRISADALRRRLKELDIV